MVGEARVAYILTKISRIPASSGIVARIDMRIHTRVVSGVSHSWIEARVQTWV
jgi:hypothetical protein